jgi:hypothetical protein
MLNLEEHLDKKTRVANAATHFEVSEPALWNWMRQGKITRFKLGAVTLVSLREIEQLIARGTAAAASEEAKQARVDEARRRGQKAAEKAADRATKAKGRKTVRRAA